MTIRDSKGRFGKGNTPYTKGVPRTQEVKDKISRANKGRVSYFTGKKHTEETKRKIREVLKSKGPQTWIKVPKGSHVSIGSEFKKGMTPWNKGKVYHKIRGKKHWNWQGGKTEVNERIRKRVKYKTWRSKVFKRDDYTCVICKIRGCRLEADHIKPFALYPDLRFDISNGRTLCIDCHRKTDTWGRRNKRFVNNKIVI